MSVHKICFLTLSRISGVTLWSVTWWQNDSKKPSILLLPIHLAEVKVFQMFQVLPYIEVSSCTWLRLVSRASERSKGQRCSLVQRRTHTERWCGTRVCELLCMNSSLVYHLTYCPCVSPSDWKWTHTERGLGFSCFNQTSSAELRGLTVTLVCVLFIPPWWEFKQHSKTQRKQFCVCVCVSGPVTPTR